MTVRGAGFDAELEALGFTRTGSSRRGQVSTLPFNRHLTFSVHDDGGDEVVVSWVFGFGEYVEELGWRLSVTDTSTAEVYPQHDVRVPRDIEAVRAELTRTLQRLRLDLGAVDL